MLRRLAGLFVAALAACQAATAPAPRPVVVEAPLSWCGAVDRALAGDDTRGLRCLSVPNFLLTGFFGPAKNPERSDFVNACFAGDGDAAARLRMSVRPVSNLSFHYSTRRTRNVGGELDLRFIGPWAPSVRATDGESAEVEVKVDLEDAELRVLPSVAEILGQEFQRSAESSSVRDSLASCITSICDEGTEPTVYTTKVLAAVPVITLTDQRNEHQGLRLTAGSAGFTVDAGKSTTARLVLRSKEKLNVAALLEVAAPAFRKARTCERVRAEKTRHEVLAKLRELGLRVLAGRALEEIPTLTAPLRGAATSSEAVFTANEQRAIVDGIETIEGAARQLSLAKPNNSLCAVRSLANVVLSGPTEDNRVHPIVVDVVQPIHERLTELANAASLPCAEPEWYLDLDRDGYGDKGKARRASVQPPGYVANALDCYDQNPEAHPGQNEFFRQHRGDGSFDYDCDGRVTRHEDVVSAGCREVTILGIPTRCWADPGWVGAVPDCGQQGKWLAECQVSALSCGIEKEPRTVQECR